MISPNYRFLSPAELHVAAEKVRLDERKLFKFTQRYFSRKELPFRLMRPVAIDELLWVRQEVEVIFNTDLEKNKDKTVQNVAQISTSFEYGKTILTSRDTGGMQ